MPFGLADRHPPELRPRTRLDALCRAIREAGADAVLLGGDIGEAPDVAESLEDLDARLGLPIHFVLGNHDYYRGTSPASAPGWRRSAPDRPGSSTWRQAGVVALTEETGLVGHDGWGDGRLGDYARSEVLLNDYLLIEELSGLDKEDRLGRLHALGDEAAAHFRTLLPEALERFRRLIVLTHVPPFREACWHRGRISDDEWLPHFSCRAVGEVLVGGDGRAPGVRDDGALRPHPFPGRGPDPPEPPRADRWGRVRPARGATNPGRGVIGNVLVRRTPPESVSRAPRHPRPSSFPRSGAVFYCWGTGPTPRARIPTLPPLAVAEILRRSRWTEP